MKDLIYTGVNIGKAHHEVEVHFTYERFRQAEDGYAPGIESVKLKGWDILEFLSIEDVEEIYTEINDYLFAEV